MNFRKTLAALATTASFLYLTCMVTTAKSADLNVGGNCCADLEERVAELEATTGRKGNRKVSLTVYGQVNYAMLFVDADGYNKTTITNNTSNMTRFGFNGSAKIGTSATAGYTLELGTTTAKGSNGVAPDGLLIRHSFMWVDTPVGKISLGKTSTATDGAAEVSVANLASVSTMLSMEPLSGTYLGGGNTPFDGTRQAVVRYDTASISGFIASAAWSANEKNAWDVALRYSAENGGFRYAGAVGYRQNDAMKTMVGSASVMHVTSGVFVNGGYGNTKLFSELTGFHVQGGVERKVFDLGKTTFYGEGLEIKANGNGGKLNAFGLGAVQSIDAAAMDVYIAGRDYRDDGIKTVIVGGIIKF
jgi:hypothetical protein